MRAYKIFSILIICFILLNNCAFAAYKSGANIAPKAKVSASHQGSDAGSTPAAINDGAVTPDGLSNTKWFLMGAIAKGQWVQFSFDNEVAVREAMVVNGNTKSSSAPDIITDFKFQYLKDGVWADIPGSEMNNNKSFEVKVKFDKPIKAESFRFFSMAETQFRIREIELYEAVETDDVYVEEGESTVNEGVLGTEYEKYYNLLFKTGILNSKWMDGTTINSIVTRQQFAEMLTDYFDYRAFDMFGPAVVSELEIRKEDEIKYTEACQAILSALGYNILVGAYGGDSIGYRAMATRLGLLRGVTIRKDEHIRFGDVLAIFYNAAFAEVIEMTGTGLTNAYSGEKVFLEKHYKIYEYSGIVQSTYLMHMDEPVNKNHVIIGGRRFHKGKTDAALYFGQNVKAWYDENDVLVNIEPRRNYMFKVDANSVDTSSSALDEMFYYAENGARQRAQISGGAYFFHNCIHMSGLPQDYNINEGEFVFIDNNSDGIIDVVQINSWENYVVSGVDSLNEKIFTSTGATMELADTSHILVKNSMSVGMEDIAKDDVITVQMSADNSVARIYASSAKLRGEVTEISKSEKLFCTINNKEYELIGQAKDTVKQIDKSGFIGRFFVNFSGKIVYIDEISSAGLTNALLTAVAAGRGSLASSQIKVLNEDGGIMVLNFAPKVYINGNPKSASDAIAIITAYGVNPLIYIRYALDEKGCVAKINCEDSGVIAEEPITANADGVYRFANLNGSYYSQNSILLDSSRTRNILLDSDTLSFTVRQDDVENEKHYLAVKGRNIGYTGLNITGETKVYNVDEFGVAGVLVHITTQKNTGIESYVDISVVAKKTHIVDVEGEAGLRLYLQTREGLTSIDVSEEAVYNVGFNNFQGDFAAYSNIYRNVRAQDLECGDVIQYAKDNDGKLISYRILIRASDADKSSPIQFVGGDGAAATYYPYLETYIGSLENYNNVSFSILSGGSTYRCVYRLPVVYVVDTALNEVYSGSLDDVLSKKYDASSPLNTFFRMSASQISEIVVYK
ncbi:MAG: discoidin domain-containing protein [Firmicutes bacterium]|nr:discoidin domain-containing protein [Bacillota bacterium]